MIANVTYGYAGATFSGRMPCVDIADAIVSKGRETLETAIKIVNTTSKWNAKVCRSPVVPWCDDRAGYCWLVSIRFALAVA